jgi:hypothetical protein
MTNKEFVSKVMNTLRFLTRDDMRSRRYILSVLKDRAKNLIAQKLGERTILDELNLFTEIKCFEFEQVETISCSVVSFRTCKILMKSKKKLPEVVYSRLGASIKSITSIDNSVDFMLVSEEQYRRNKKRKYTYRAENSIYLGTDGHLYIPDQEILAVNIVALTMNPEDTEDCSECSDSPCKSGWDYDFIVPSKLEDVVFKEALQIISMNRQITEDPNPNNLERQ